MCKHGFFIFLLNIQKTKFNIFILGDTQVGKTCMIQILKDNTFNPDEFPTIWLEIFMDIIQFEDKEYKFKIFDTSGREKFRNIILSKLHLADGFMFVFSVNNIDSLKHVDFWNHIIDENINLKKMKILVGNKIDTKKRKISNQEAVNFAKERKMKYIETSAKTGFSIKDASNNFYKELYESNKQFELKNKI